MLVPQEVALGIGVLAGNIPKDQWPAQGLWPIHFLFRDGEHHPVVPGLDLGWDSLHHVGKG
jgi:hypothetical protein